MNGNTSAPAFSMGKGKEREHIVRRDKDLKGTGPGAYNTHGAFPDKKHEPVFSMGAKLQSSLVRRDAGS